MSADARQAARASAKAERRRVAEALAGLGVLVGRKPPQDAVLGSLRSGVAALLDALGVAYRAPAPQAGDDPFRDARHGLDAHGVRWRNVTLGAAWWKTAGDTLILASRDGQRTLAALPRIAGGYDLLAGPGLPRRRMRAALAGDLRTDALAVQAPVRGGGWSAAGLLRHGLRGIRLPWVRVALAFAVSGLLSLATPIVSGWIMESIVPAAERAQLGVITVVLLLAAVAGGLVHTVRALLLMRLEGLLDNRVQSAIWDRLLRLPVGFFRRYSVGDLANRANSINQMRQMLSQPLIGGSAYALGAAFSFALLLYVSWRLALGSLVLVLVYAVALVLIGRVMLASSGTVWRRTGVLQGVSLQIVLALNRIRVTGAERRAFALWARHYADLTRATLHQQRLSALGRAFNQTLAPLSLGLAIGLLGWQAGVLLDVFRTPQGWADLPAGRVVRTLSAADFVTFNAALAQFAADVTGLTAALLALARIAPLYDRVAPLIQEPEEDGAGPGSWALATPPKGEVRFSDVTFRYRPDGPAVLNDVSFHVPAGAFVAIVGQSGAGKSTIVRLLLGFERPAHGAILFDGADIATLPKAALRRACGVVLQDGKILAGSIRDNIALGAEVSDEAVWQAATRACLADDLTAMPMGLDTHLGVGGAALSGGQRQRLLIARALVRRPALLILDEATSALDNAVQAQLGAAIQDLRMTRLVIAHRLSTVVRADRILVLAKGRIVEAGTYEELLALDGHFAALARRQLPAGDA